MKPNFVLTVIFLFVVTIVGAQELSLDEILSKHFEALGLDQIQKVNTITMKGTMVQQDAMPVKIVKMRPDKFLMEFDVQDITAYQGYDGQTAWWTIPWTGHPEPQLMPEERAKDVRSKADFDGLFYKWKEKGHLVELMGRDTMENSIAFKLKLTKKDGGVEYYFMDVSRYLVLKRMYSRVARGQETFIEIYFRDYRPVQGVMLAFAQDTFIGGQPYNSLQFDSIELNLPVDTQQFRMPVK